MTERRLTVALLVFVLSCSPIVANLVRQVVCLAIGITLHGR